MYNRKLINSLKTGKKIVICMLFTFQRSTPERENETDWFLLLDL